MKKQIQFLAIIVYLMGISNIAFSQGCSDAGICTINIIKDHSFNIRSEVNKRNYFRSGITYGLGEYDINITNPYVEYSNLLTDKISIFGKLTYAFINGELANTSNLSDLVITTNYILFNKESNTNIIAGVKIPLNNSNILENENPLPMHYQSSLGSYDFIIGINYLYNKLGVSIALQQPFNNSNENEFVSSLEPNLTESKYQSTNLYERKGDLMNRISFNVSFLNNKFTIRPSILSIYHLRNDTFIDENDIKQEIEGSQGLTLNGNIFFNYYFSTTKQIELSVGSPFLTRDSRPDGLTRKLVIGIEYMYAF